MVKYPLLRGLSFLIDSGLASVPGSLLYYLNPAINHTGLYFFGVVCSCVYFCGSPYFFRGQTLGMAIFGLQIKSLNENPLSIYDLFRRYIFAVLILSVKAFPNRDLSLILTHLDLIFSAYLLSSTLPVLFNRTRLTLWDQWSNTAVVWKNQPMSQNKGITASTYLFLFVLALLVIYFDFALNLSW